MFLFNLSNFAGTVPYSWVRLFVDNQMNEVYAVDVSEKSVRIFNESGMEVFAFGDDEALGVIYDAVVDPEGSIFALSYRGDRYSILRCNYRGESLSRIEPKNIPSEFSEFSPDRIAYREGSLYLADTGSLRVVVTDANGLFKDGYDIASLVGIGEKRRRDANLGGFSVDKDGNMLFTITVLFKAYRLSPDRKIMAFGEPGSIAGKFGVVAGIVEDNRGSYLVADTLRSVVMIFDKDLKFLAEFGYYGYGLGNLIGPKDLAMDNRDRVYIAQLGNRGVSVFRLSYN